MNTIQDIRKASGLSQSAFAEELGVTQSMVSQYERDEARPGIDLALRLVAIAKKHGKRVKLEDVMRRPTKDSAHA